MLLITLVLKWKVRLHITLKHSEIAADVNVEVLEPGSSLVMFLHKYFPDTPGTRLTRPTRNSPALCDTQVLFAYCFH